jgi:outer membrane lipoprotein-sorting protein
MISSFRLGALACSAFVLAIAAHGQTAIITKARAALGTEAALDAVKSVHYIGKLVKAEGDDPTKGSEASVDIIFQKPDRHRIVVTSDKTIETTALNGYDGWQRLTDARDSSRWRQSLASVEQIKRIRANTWENVSFFRGIETRGGKIEVLQPATVDGIMCSKVAFIYAPNIIFYRYFNQDTGRLVMTETESGSQIREEGEMIVEGVRFPHRIITTNKNPEAKSQTVTITLEQIKVNETFPDSVFAVPAYGPK